MDGLCIIWKLDSFFVWVDIDLLSRVFSRDKLIHHTTAPTGLTNRSTNFLVAVSAEASFLELVDFVVGSLVFGAVGLYVGMRDLESFQLLASRLNFGQSRKLAHIHFESGRVVNLWN